ncbi:MAG: hypothetical protein U1A78_17960 [Polyangia bacterium]
MPKLIDCPSCNGFMTPADAACPHCQRPAAPTSKTGPGWLVGGLAALCGGAIAVTLMACYGSPQCGPRQGCEPPDLTPAPTDMLSCTDGGADAGCAQRDGG